MMDLNRMGLEALYRVSQCIGEASTPKETVLDILNILDEQLGYHNGTVTLVDPETGDLLVEAAQGIRPEKWENVHYKRGEGIVGTILLTRKPLAIPVIKQDPRFLNRLGSYNQDDAFLGVPILQDKEPIGVFTITINARERFRFDEHLKVVTTFANFIGGVISRIIRAEQEKEKYIRENDQLQSELKNNYKSTGLVGVSKIMTDVSRSITQVAKWNTTVLIRGESGTGKELAAKSIHYQSPRSNGPFIKLNCAALPDNLLESELFGYEKGAFTGAVRRHPGRFELADGGTIFLDEIGDTSLAFQTKLLRVLQERQFERLGGEETITVDVRIITATHVDLEKSVMEGGFREDLYYRLNVMPIRLPALRERREDVPYLVEHFIKKFEEECGETFSIEPSALQIMQQCNWPGNVRELENCVQRAAVTASDSKITPENLPCCQGQCLSRIMHEQAPQNLQSITPEPEVSSHQRLDLNSIENERDRVIAALEQAGWVQAKAARLLDMTPRQIAYRIQKLNIPVKKI